MTRDMGMEEVLSARDPPGKSLCGTEPRAVEPPEQGRVVAIPQVGDYTTDTSDATLSRSKPVASTFAFLERKGRFSLI